MSTELLPKVELWQLSEHAIRTLEEIVRRVLVENGHAAVGAFRAASAAKYIGVGRSTFYELLKTDPHLQRSYLLVPLFTSIRRAPLWRLARQRHSNLSVPLAPLVRGSCRSLLGVAL
jgi:hypothetical protein